MTDKQYLITKAAIDGSKILIVDGVPRKQGPLSVRMLSIMLDYMTEDDAADPQHIAEAVANELQGHVSDADTDDIYDQVFWLASTLVKDTGEYK